MRQAGLVVPIRKYQATPRRLSAMAKLGINICRKRPMNYPTAALQKVKGQP